MGKCDDESAACKQDNKDYTDASFERGTAEQKIKQLTLEIDSGEKAFGAAAATAGVGVAIMWGAGWTGVGAIVGGVIGVGAAVTALALAKKIAGLKEQRAQARKDCDAARAKMKAAYDKSLTDCMDADCRPSANIPLCS